MLEHPCPSQTHRPPLLLELSWSQWPTICTPFPDEKTESPEIAGQRNPLPGRS